MRWDGLTCLDSQNQKVLLLYGGSIALPVGGDWVRRGEITEASQCHPEESRGDFEI